MLVTVWISVQRLQKRSWKINYFPLGRPLGLWVGGYSVGIVFQAAVYCEKIRLLFLFLKLLYAVNAPL